MADLYIYFVVPYADVTDEMVEKSQETSRDTLRHTVAGADLVVIKTLTTEAVPPDFEPYQQYNNEEISQLMAGADWKVVVPYP